LLRNPPIDALIQQVERHLGTTEDRVMETTNVELATQSILRPLAQFRSGTK
jgi:hypothetical protein